MKFINTRHYLNNQGDDSMPDYMVDFVRLV